MFYFVLLVISGIAAWYFAELASYHFMSTDPTLPQEIKQLRLNKSSMRMWWLLGAMGTLVALLLSVPLLVTPHVRATYANSPVEISRLVTDTYVDTRTATHCNVQVVASYPMGIFPGETIKQSFSVSCQRLSNENKSEVEQIIATLKAKQ